MLHSQVDRGIAKARKTTTFSSLFAIEDILIHTESNTSTILFFITVFCFCFTVNLTFILIQIYKCV